MEKDQGIYVAVAAAATTAATVVVVVVHDTMKAYMNM